MNDETPLSPAEMHGLVSGSPTFYQILPAKLFWPSLVTDIASSIASAFLRVRFSSLIRIQIPRPGAFLLKSILFYQ